MAVTWNPLPRYADDPNAYLHHQHAHGEWLKLRGQAHGASYDQLAARLRDLEDYWGSRDHGEQDPNMVATLAGRIVREAGKLRADQRLAAVEASAVDQGMAVRS